MLALVLAMAPATPAFAADEPDLIFRRSTVFKWISPNDKLATYGVDDPEVEGVACHFTVPEKGGFKGWLDRKSTRLNSSHIQKSRMPSSA